MATAKTKLNNKEVIPISDDTYFALQIKLPTLRQKIDALTLEKFAKVVFFLGLKEVEKMSLQEFFKVYEESRR